MADPTPPRVDTFSRGKAVAAVVAVAAVLVVLALWPTGGSDESSPPTTAPRATSTTAPSGEPPTRQQVVDDAGPITPEDRLTRQGDLRIDRPGEVVEGVWVAGVVEVTAAADGAVLRDCVVEGARDTLVVRVAEGAEDVTIEHCRLAATAPSEGVVGSQGGAPRMVVRSNVIEGQADGIKADHDGVYERNVIAVWKAPDSDAHLDGLQASGRQGVTARWNVVTSTIADGLNFALFGESFAGGECRDMGTIDFSGNWVDGGNRGVVVLFMGHEGCPTRPYAERVVITNNVFAADPDGFVSSATGFRFSYYMTSSDAPAGIVTVGDNLLADGRAVTGATTPS